MKAIKFAAFGAIFLLFTRLAPASVPILNQYGQEPLWSSMPIHYWISAVGSSQISNGSDFQAVQAAFQTWQNVSTAAISFTFMGTTPVSTVGHDGLNVVTFADDTVPLGSGTVSATFSFMTVDDTGALIMQESDIALNPTIPFSTSGEPGKYDIQSIVTHEVGHLLGLEHSPLLSAVMTPRSTPGQLDQRTLTFDDTIGIEGIYPGNSAFIGTGYLVGYVYSGTTGLFGTHVIAIDSNGTAITSVLSDVDGSFNIPVPAGTYRVVVEPLDGPVVEADVGGTPTSYFYQLNTGFSTTYYGDVSDLGHALTRSVSAGRNSATINIHVLAATDLNLLSPGTFAQRIGVGSTVNLTIGGVSVVSPSTISVSGAGMIVGTPAFGASISSDSPTSAAFTVAVPNGTALGAKNLAISQNGLTSILAGGLVVTNAPPATTQVAPGAGTTAGGVQVTVSGQNFQAGAQIYFGGLAASNVSFVNAQTLQATIPPNVPGPIAVVVVNPDGTWGVQPQAFSYTAVTPSILSVSPPSASSGTIVAIQGSGFDTRIQNVAVQFNGTPATVISTTRTSIQAAVPYNATSGSVSISVLGQNAQGPTFTINSLPASSNAPTGSSPFIDASTAAGGTALSMPDPDDSAALVQLPFAFTLFDKTYAAGSLISVSTNGWLSLDAVTAPDYQSIPLPGPTAAAMIAPYFDDLFIRSGGDITVRAVGAAPNRQFVIEWSNMGVLNANGSDVGAVLTFEAVLYETTNDIQFAYQSASGPDSDASTATIGFQNSARTNAVLVSYDQSTVSSGLSLAFLFINGNYTPAGVPSTFSVAPAGAASFISSGASPSLTVGYATIQQSNGAMTSGVAIFDYRVNGILVTEGAVPASGLIQHGRIYAVAGPVGNTSVDTGVAIANPNSSPATITFNFTDSNGNDFGSGTAVVPANGQIASFIDQTVFNAPATMQGTMTFTSSAPVSVIALEGLTNERNEFLITTLPVTDLSATTRSSPVTIPHFAAGGGWTTQVVLVNPTGTVLNGTIQFIAPDGTSLSSSPYTVAANSSYRYQPSGSGTVIQVGSVHIAPGTGTTTPVALTIFAFENNQVTVTQTGAPAIASTALRTYVEASGTLGAVGSIQSGIAIANPSASPVNVTLNLTDLSGNPLATTTLALGANSQVAEFLDQIFSGITLPQSVQGMLEIEAAGSGVAAVGLRGRYNERSDFLTTTMPMLDETVPVTGPQYFPHFADGGGYTTQFVLFSGTAGQPAGGSLVFTGQNGGSLNIVLHK